jgi:hypothetical protein
MKRVVTGGELSQHAMRPADLQDAYLTRAASDITTCELLIGGCERSCPACGGTGEVEFVRLGFPYHRCDRCRSLFVSPLPDAQRLARYHEEGEAERFRREQMLPVTASVRARHALAPRVHWVMTAAARLGSSRSFAHLGAGGSPYLDLLRAAGADIHSAESVSRETPAALVDGVIAFDVLERSAEFTSVLRRCRDVLRPRGLLFVTTMSGDGLEVRVLGSRTRSLVPPVHLQLLSRAGWLAALGREGFTLVEYSTPGELDVQAVAEVCQRDPGVRLPPILDDLIRHDDDQVGRAFQEVLQQAGLSAHVQLVAEVSE